MATTYITNTSVTPTNAKKYTFSFWVKRNKILIGAAAQRLINVYTDSDNKLQVAFGTDDRLSIFDKESGATRFSVTPSMVFRDNNAWYHVVIAADTTQATDTNRMKIYVNGELQTALESGPTYAGQDTNTGAQLTGSGARRIGTNESATSTVMFDGLLSHFHFVDGTQYAASDFGSTDSTTGEWKINTAPSVTHGNNGYFILKDGNSLTDQSVNSNNWSVGAGTLGNTEDCPSNNFPVLNQLNLQSTGYTFDGLGSLSVTGNGGDAWRTMYATFGASSGKYYWEQKITNFTGVDPHYIGIVSDDQMSQTNIDQATTSRGYFYTKTGAKRNNNSQTSYGDSWTTNDIVGIALDLDNSKLYFSKNGTWQDSGDPTSGSTGTGAAFTITSGYTYIPATSTYYNLNRYAMNFGNGYFGTTAVSSAGTNASNIGIFEYDVPTGYTALSTKGLNE